MFEQTTIASAIAAQRPAVLAIAHSPLRLQQHDVRAVPAVGTLAELAPETQQPMVCVLNGRAILRANWHHVHILPGDQIVFQMLPLGGDGSNPLRVILTIVVMVVAWYAAPYLAPMLGGNLGLAQAAIAFVGNAIISALLPPPAPPSLTPGQTPSPSPTYNVSLGGNSARIGQVIPVGYGHHIIYPDHAAQPYTRYRPNTTTGADDQYYYTLLCIGQGDYEIESINIDDTLISHFEDVSYNVFKPGDIDADSGEPYPVLVNPCVVNAPEIAGQDLETSRYIGPFAVCGHGRRASKIEIDIVWPKGLGFMEDDGSLSSKSSSWLVEARRINLLGAPTSSWVLLASEELTAETNTPLRKTFEYTLSSVGRYEVRILRFDERDTNNRALHDMQWGGMRAFLVDVAPLEPSATFIEIEVRASQQLSGMSQRRISVVFDRLLPTWNPDTGWGAPEKTRSIAWAFADVMRNDDYGAGLPDTRVDLQTLYELDAVWAARKDYFDGIFDSRVTFWSALMSIARAGRAAPLMRNGVFTLTRDAAQTLPVALFNMRNIIKGSFEVEYISFTEESADALEVEYFDAKKWEPAYFTLPIPGVDINDIQNPKSVKFFGISNEYQAKREAAFILAETAYRRQQVAFQTELEGFIPTRGSLIAVSHDITGWGTSGEIVEWDAATQTAVMSEIPQWATETGAVHYAMLARVDGSVSEPLRVMRGDTPREVVFVDDPEFEPYTGYEREKTRISVGTTDTFTRLCVVTAINPQADGTVNITAVVEDARVHTADEDYITPGDNMLKRFIYAMANNSVKYTQTPEADRDPAGFACDEFGFMSNGDGGYYPHPGTGD